ncbi:MAG: tetratricopeptide repeat protein [Bacteroidetes bacterium]|nr:tetratricopeptide repeat protein [Bacteroidota bacterium]
MKTRTRKKTSARSLKALAGILKANRAFPPAMPPMAHLITISVIFIWAFLLYGNTLLNKFSVDDNLVTHNTIARQGFKAIPLVFSSYLADDEQAVSQKGSYKPLSRASFAIEYGLWGERPGRSHLVNVFLYFFASLITFYVLRRLLINYNILFPVLITVLFMAHPVHAEVVASLKNRDELFAFIFGMTGMYTLLSYSYSRNMVYLLFSCGWFILACIGQVSALPFAGLYMLVLYFFGNLKRREVIIAGIMILFAVVAAFLVPRIFIHQPRWIPDYIDNALFFEKNFWIRLGTSLMSLFFYIRILLYPHPLLYYYGYNAMPLTSLFHPLAVLSILVHTFLLGYAIVHIRRKTFLSFAVCWYLTGVLIYSNLALPVAGVVAERFVFLASLGFIMALVFLVFKLFNTEPNSLTIELESRVRIIGLLIPLLVVYWMLTINRNSDWRDTGTLFSSDIPRLEESAGANSQYAGYLLTALSADENINSYGFSNQTMPETIKKHFRLSLKVYPLNCDALNELGSVFLLSDKRYDSALYYFQKTTAVDPLYTPAWVNMGIAYHQLGNYSKAIECYEKVVEQQPGNTAAYFAIADLYYELGNVTKARYYYGLGHEAAGKTKNRSF